MPGLNRSIDIIRSRIKKILERNVARELDSLFPAINHQQADNQPPASPEPPTTDGPTYGALDCTFTGQSSRLSAAGDFLVDDSEVLDYWLPAFPGQNISFGSEVMLDMPDDLSPRTRSALLGSNLYPHMQLNVAMPDEPNFDYGSFSAAASGPQPCDEHAV